MVSTCMESFPYGPIREDGQVLLEEVRAFVDGISAEADVVMKGIDGLTRNDWRAINGREGLLQHIGRGPKCLG